MDKLEASKRNYNTHCMDCGKETEIGELVHTGEDWEMWNYCKPCDIETFHPAEPE